MASINGKLSIGARAGANLGTQTRYIPGPRGPSGVFVGSGEMPEDCNVQIDPNGSEDDAVVLTTVQTLSDEAKAQARENIGAAKEQDDTETIALLVEADMLPAVYNADGAILTDENGNVILRY